MEQNNKNKNININNKIISDELFKGILREIYAVKAENELVAIEKRSNETQKIHETCKKKLTETEDKLLGKLNDLLEGFDFYLSKHQAEIDFYLPIQSELLIYIEDLLLPLLEKEIENEDISQEKLKSEFNFKANIHFMDLQKKIMEIEKEFGAKSKKFTTLVKELNLKYGSVLASWKKEKQKVEASSEKDKEEIAALYQDMIDNLIIKFAKYKLPITSTVAIDNNDIDELCGIKSSLLKEKVEICQTSKSKVISIPVSATTSKNENPIVKASNKPIKKNINNNKSSYNKKLTTTITPVLNVSLNDSQLSTCSTGSKRRALIQLNDQKQDLSQEIVPRKTSLKKKKIGDENVSLAEEKVTPTKLNNFNPTKRTEDSKNSNIFFPINRENIKADDKSDSAVLGNGIGNSNNKENEQSNNSPPFNFSGSPFDLNTSFCLGIHDDDRMSNPSMSFDLGDFDTNDGIDNGSFLNFKF